MFLAPIWQSSVTGVRCVVDRGSVFSVTSHGASFEIWCVAGVPCLPRHTYRLFSGPLIQLVFLFVWAPVCDICALVEAVRVAKVTDDKYLFGQTNVTITSPLFVR